MKKIIAVLSLSLMLAAAPLSADQSQHQKVSPTVLNIINSAPAATGATMFEVAAAQINRWIDEHNPKLAKAQRPYVTPRLLAQAADSLVKNYRAGDKLILTEIAARVPYALSVDEKVDILEKVTRAYLEAEAKKRK